MSSLRDLQQQFAAGVFEEVPAVLGDLRDGVFPAERHLQVYRNNTFANLTDALAAIYPVVQRLVGEEFFGYAAHAYVRAHPPRSGNLHDFGGALAPFLANFPPTQSLAYLPSVARLEWCWHEAFHAADAATFPLAALSAVAPEQYERLVFRLHPSVRLVASSYPILRIWQVNQPEHDGDVTVDLELGGDRLLVVRRGLTAQIDALSAGEYALLAAFLDSRPLTEAHLAATHAEPDFDLTRALHTHVGAGTITGFELDDNKE